jgi:hypothetical protein
LERGWVSRHGVDPFLCRGRLPQLGAAAKQGDQLKSVAVLCTPLLLIDGGVAVGEDAGGKETAARFGVYPVVPPFLDRQVLVCGDYRIINVLAQDLRIRNTL